jgi:hypothetical protein
VSYQDIYRCSDGHFYGAAPLKALLLSVHLGVGKHYQRCPVDRRWRLAVRISPDDLSEPQLAEASHHNF